jgi:hypothetical protein
LKNRELVKSLLLQTAVAAVLVIGYLAWDADAMYEWLSGDVTFGATAPDCDLHKEACTGTLEDGTPITFSITPKPIPVMEKLQFKVKADAIERDTLKIEMYGINMNMGRYSYTLKRDAEGAYVGEGMIPSCIANMQWRANIIDESPTKRTGTYFTFITE